MTVDAIKTSTVESFLNELKESYSMKQINNAANREASDEDTAYMRGQQQMSIHAIDVIVQLTMKCQYLESRLSDVK